MIKRLLVGLLIVLSGGSVRGLDPAAAQLAAQNDAISESLTSANNVLYRYLFSRHLAEVGSSTGYRILRETVRPHFKYAPDGVTEQSLNAGFSFIRLDSMVAQPQQGMLTSVLELLVEYEPCLLFPEKELDVLLQLADLRLSRG